jgi:hypothetical protein
MELSGNAVTETQVRETELAPSLIDKIKSELAQWGNGVS